MMYFLNIIDEIANSNALFSILIIILIVVSLITFYLMSTQNKEITKQINEARRDNELLKEKKQIDSVEEIVQNDNKNTFDNNDNIKNEEINSNNTFNKDIDIRDYFAEAENEMQKLSSEEDSFSLPVFESVSSYDTRDLDLFLLDSNISKNDNTELAFNSEYGDERNIDVIEESNKESNLDNSLDIENKEYTKEDLSKNYEENDIYRENQNIDIHNKDNDENVFDLNDVTKELESATKEKTIDLTPYEAYQEENAIISYDELVKQASLLQNRYTEENVNSKENVTNNLDASISEQNIPELSSYEHEEEFLKALKQLQEILN